MRLRTKIQFAISGVLLVAFLFFISDIGQKILIGKPPKDATPFELDDLYMGVGLAPWIYLLIPSILFMLVGLVLSFLDRKTSEKKD